MTLVYAEIERRWNQTPPLIARPNSRLKRSGKKYQMRCLEILRFQPQQADTPTLLVRSACRYIIGVQPPARSLAGACSRKEGGMIELTESQRQSLKGPNGEPIRVVDPGTKQEYVLLKVEEYQVLVEGAYDDGDWTDEEMGLLAAEIDAMLDDDMAIEDAPQ